MRASLCVCLLAAAVAAGTLPGGSSATKTRACGNPGYSYAGLQSVRRAHGVRTTLTAIARPWVENGHVAAWVGVGGPGQGANGSDAWIQVGIAAFAGTGSKLYYEVTRPAVGPRYHEIDANVRAGERKRVAVLEMSRRPGHWRVWVNGRPVSEPVYLRASSGRWRPIATAETWDGGRRVCNGFAYRFDGLRVAAWRGGSWERFLSGYRWEDPGYRVQRRSRAGFRALAMAAPVWRRDFWDSRLPQRAPAPAVPAAPSAVPASPPVSAPDSAAAVATAPAPTG